MTVLFLDFDGVLRHADVIVDLDADRSRVPRIRGPGRLLQWAPALGETLAPFPDVGIVLSTNGSSFFGLNYCRVVLPPSLSSRVVGAVSDGRTNLPRCDQIRQHVLLHDITDWIALDDDDTGLTRFAPDRGRFVICNPALGISEARVLDELEELLAGRRP